jgi:hypothetical protein
MSTPKLDFAAKARVAAELFRLRDAGGLKLMNLKEIHLAAKKIHDGISARVVQAMLHQLKLEYYKVVVKPGAGPVTLFPGIDPGAIKTSITALEAKIELLENKFELLLQRVTRLESVGVVIHT